MLPNHRGTSLVESIEILWGKEAGDDGYHDNLTETIFAPPITRLVATLLHSFERVHLNSDRLRLNQDELSIAFAPNNHIRLLACDTSHFAFFGILAEIDISSIFNLARER